MTLDLGKYILLMIAIEHVWLGLVLPLRWHKGMATELLGIDEEEMEATRKFASILGVIHLVIAAGVLWMTLPDGAPSQHLRPLLLTLLSLEGIVAFGVGYRRLGLLIGLPSLLGQGYFWFVT